MTASYVALANGSAICGLRQTGRGPHCARARHDRVDLWWHRCCVFKTGKPFAVPGVSVIEIRNGRISRNLDYYDSSAIMKQVGVCLSEPWSWGLRRNGPAPGLLCLAGNSAARMRRLVPATAFTPALTTLLPGAWRAPRSPDRGFSRPYEISYRGVKLPRVSAALGRSDLRRGAALPQMGCKSHQHAAPAWEQFLYA
jgi:hypothetical protein